MAGLNLEGKLDEKNRGMLATGSAFALGVITGVFLKEAARQVYARARDAAAHREYDRTVTYDQNLPDSLGRREPESGQPRYGGTGALGVPPTSAGIPPSGR